MPQIRQWVIRFRMLWTIRREDIAEVDRWYEERREYLEEANRKFTDVEAQIEALQADYRALNRSLRE